MHASKAALQATLKSDFAPTHILQLLEQIVQGRGLVLKELAVSAATLSDFVFQVCFRSLSNTLVCWSCPLRRQFLVMSLTVLLCASFAEPVTGEWFSF